MVPSEGVSLAVHVVREGAVLHVQLVGELDRATAPMVRRRFDAALAAGVRHFEVDCRALTFIDGGGLEVLERLLDLVVDRDGSVVLTQPSSILCRVLAIAGLDDRFDLRLPELERGAPGLLRSSPSVARAGALSLERGASAPSQGGPPAA